MFDFSALPEIEPGYVENPFAGRSADGEYLPGGTSIEWLNTHFGAFATASEMQAATDDEGLKRFFGWLADEGKIPL